MSTLVSILVTVNDGTQDRTFEVDIENDCALFWNKDGWDVLADYYKDVKKDPAKEKEVRDRTCPKAKPREGSALAEAAPGAAAVIALKTPSCLPTEWP